MRKSTRQFSTSYTRISICLLALHDKEDNRDHMITDLCLNFHCSRLMFIQNLSDSAASLAPNPTHIRFHEPPVGYTHAPMHLPSLSLYPQAMNKPHETKLRLNFHCSRLMFIQNLSDSAASLTPVDKPH